MSTITENQEKCGWIKFSESKLISLEKKIFEVLNTAYKGWHVLIDHKPNIKAKIWTIAMNTESKNIPLVLLHGFGAGVGFWCLNLDSLAANRPVYAIDILGFGRSSRPEFSNDGLEAEQEFIDSIEKWRKEVKLDQFILLGHSLGGYLATSYTISYPNQVKHLILADPWGFVERPSDFNPPLWMKTLGIVLYPFTAFNPLATLRAAGPFGPWIVKKMRSDISHKYAGRLENHEIITDYIYQCNSQKPTGETAFHKMIKGFGWAKNPMLNRIHKLDSRVPITVMNGSHTWMDKTVGKKLKEMRQNSYVRLEVIKDAGHHVHADNPECFNEIVVDVCNFTETNKSNALVVPENDNIQEEEEIITETQIATS
ncbi:(Lyso)-N-acylphosphatidylethanolamine lipase-like [Tribolium madens]|uniref:(Lyso)-N-acylphosphatidylethanolamine lipase-like n=1 Tax=Tribolium madens TaxID=41895 RepID=UPI001CF729BB|nr:(Lyso)-N-acylphosphatidylethanolamine lipase-like [Tribolium madens]